MTGHDKPRILMLGDSLIDYGEWHRRLAGYRVVSRGVPGERTEELLRRLPLKMQADVPDALVLMSGTNNIVFGDFSFIESTRQMLSRLRGCYPQVPVLVTSLLPCEIPSLIDSIHTANEQLRLVCNEGGGIYVDVCRHFEDSFEELFDYDGIHLSNSGYRLWAAVLDEYLRKLLAKAGD